MSIKRHSVAVNLYLYLLEFVDILCFLDVQLEDVEDSPVDVQHSRRHTSRSEHFADNAVSVLKLDWCQELSSQGRGELSGWNEGIFGPDATVLKELRVDKLKGKSDMWPSLHTDRTENLYIKKSQI